MGAVSLSVGSGRELYVISVIDYKIVPQLYLLESFSLNCGIDILVPILLKFLVLLGSLVLLFELQYINIRKGF